MEEMAAGLSKGLEGRSFDGSLKFDCGDEGVIVVAGGAADTRDRETDCTIRMSRPNLEKLLAGKLNPMTGVMTGKLKVSGDMGVAMKLAQLL
ncbi:sterol carrier protein [Rhodobacteraceae bacterium 63075]|nr:sterol carrier protein [Rhodobacteraceae bacterium 63075]